MTKIWKACFFLSFFASYSFIDENFQHTSAGFKLKGNVKSVYENTICTKPGVHCKDYLLCQWFNVDGELLEDSTHVYDKNTPDITHICIKNGDTIIQYEHGNTGLFPVYSRYTYNHSGKLLEEVDFYADKKGNLQKGRFYFKYIYDGRVIKKYQISNDSSYRELETSRINGRGELVMSENDFCKTTMKYDERGNEVEIIYSNKDPKMDGTEVFTYDDMDNIIEDVLRMPNAHHPLVQKQNYKYEYDQFGNWIKREHFLGDTAREIVTRQIEYYK